MEQSTQMGKTFAFKQSKYIFTLESYFFHSVFNHLKRKVW